jgi:basic amino acid/polyamine antiporter, APA family
MNNKQEDSSFSKDLGLKEALAIGLGTMMGAGIFVLSAEAAGRAGPAASFSFLIAGLIVLPIAMTLSEMITAIPKEGGSYSLIARGLGPLASGVMGPANWLGLIFALGFYLIGFAQYFAQIVNVPHWVTVLVVGIGVIILNYRGARLTGKVEVYVVAVLLLILLFFIIRGIPSIQSEFHDPFFPQGGQALFATIGLIIVSYTGFEKISTVAEEIQSPGKNIPRAVIGSVIVATALYFGVLFVMTGVMPFQDLAGAEAPLMAAGGRFMGGIGTMLMLVGGLLATLSSTIAAMMASSRINYAMGRDRILPSWFGKIHPRFRTPNRSIVVTGALAILLALSGQAPLLAEISSMLFMVSYALLVLNLIVLRIAAPEWYRPVYRVPLYPLLPMVGGIASLVVILTKDTFSQLAGGGLLLLSLAFYLVWGRKHTQIQGVGQEAIEKIMHKFRGENAR